MAERGHNYGFLNSLRLSTDEQRSVYRLEADPIFKTQTHLCLIYETGQSQRCSLSAAPHFSVEELMVTTHLSEPQLSGLPLNFPNLNSPNGREIRNIEFG